MQTPNHDEQRENELLPGPSELVSALRQATEHDLFIPATVDEALASAARRHLHRPERPRVRWLRLVPWAAAAGVLFLAVFAVRFTKSLTGTPQQPVFVREDLNHDGRVDILDAFALARQLKSRTALSPGLDINGDGVVDERDVASIAARGVKLERGGRS